MAKRRRKAMVWKDPGPFDWSCVTGRYRWAMFYGTFLIAGCAAYPSTPLTITDEARIRIIEKRSNATTKCLPQDIQDCIDVEEGVE